MNDVAIYNLKRIEKNYNERCVKAKLYNKLISDKVATKTNCFSSDNALLEYTLILKNIDNRKAHTILMLLRCILRRRCAMLKTSSQCASKQNDDTKPDNAYYDK